VFAGEQTTQISPEDVVFAPANIFHPNPGDWQSLFDRLWVLEDDEGESKVNQFSDI
jgi:hypothetical protein